MSEERNNSRTIRDINKVRRMTIEGITITITTAMTITTMEAITTIMVEEATTEEMVDGDLFLDSNTYILLSLSFLFALTGWI